MPGTSQPDSTAQTVRCPTCRREHAYEPPVMPCPCGASLKVPLLRGGVPTLIRFRSWEDSWLSMRCPRCGRSEQWPQPEITCPCGAVVRLPVDTARPYEPPVLPLPPADRGYRDVPARPAQGRGAAAGGGSGGRPREDLRHHDSSLRGGPYGDPYPADGPAGSADPWLGHEPEPHEPERDRFALPRELPGAGDYDGRPGDREASGDREGDGRAARAPFLPHPVRTSEDAVVAAARYLEWLGFGDLEVSDSQDRDGVCLLGSRIVAQVDTWTEPADLRAVECVWLNTLHAEELAPVMITLAGYAREALHRADQLLVALFELDLAGMPQPCNGSARELIRTGATS